MERYKELSDINDIFLDTSLEKYPLIIKTIKKCIHKNCNKRYSINELCDIFDKIE